MKNTNRFTLGCREAGVVKPGAPGEHEQCGPGESTPGIKKKHMNNRSNY